MGIEPTLSAWEAEVLPLNYTRKRNFQIFYAIFPVGQLSMKPFLTGKNIFTFNILLYQVPLARQLCARLSHHNLNPSSR